MEAFYSIAWNRVDVWGWSFLVITLAMVIIGAWRLSAGEATASATLIPEEGDRRPRVILRALSCLSFILIFGELFSQEGQLILVQLIRPILKFFHAGNQGSFTTENLSFQFAGTLAAQLIAAGILLLLAKAFPGFIQVKPNGSDQKKLNLNRADMLRLGGLFATCLTLLALAALVWSIFSHVAASQGQNLPDDIQDIVQLVARWNGPSWVMSLLFLSVTLGAPVIEEIGFRGIIYPALGDVLPRGWAIALTGVLFGSMHGNLAAFLPITVMGAWLCIVRDRFGLGTCIVLHAMNNAWTLFWVIAAPEVATKL